MSIFNLLDEKIQLNHSNYFVFSLYVGRIRSGHLFSR